MTSEDAKKKRERELKDTRVISEQVVESRAGTKQVQKLANGVTCTKYIAKEGEEMTINRWNK